MSELLAPYHLSIIALLVLAVLMTLQFGIADVAGIKAKHVPGMPIAGGHDDFHFRAARAYANSYENMGLFLLVLLLCFFTGANPLWTGVWTCVFVAGRAGHMACYYADLRTLRSVFFGIGGLGQIGLLGSAILAAC